MLLGYIWLLGTFVDSSCDIKINNKNSKNCCIKSAVNGLTSTCGSHIIHFYYILSFSMEKKRSSETEDHEKQCLATLKQFKQGDENELERKLRLERRWSLGNSSGWPWRRKKKEEQDWRMIQLPNSSDWLWRLITRHLRWSKKEKDWRDGR